MQRYDERKENLREAGRKGGLSKAKTMPERGSSNAKASVKQPSTTRVKESKVKESKEEKKNLNADYVAIVSLLMSEIEKNDSKHFQGKDRDSISRQWYDPIRLLIEKDGREPDLVRSVITWSQGSDFWKSNILSTKKLREKFSQLLLQMNNVKNNPPDEEELFATEPKFTPKDIPLQWKRN
jgi:hypothetical protein